MTNTAIFGKDNLKFTKKTTECTIGALIVLDGLNICSGTINKASLYSITKSNLWEYLVYIYDHNKGPGQKFSGIKSKSKFLEHIVKDIIDYLAMRKETGVTSTGKLKYLKKEQLYRYVNHFVLTSSNLDIPLIRDHCKNTDETVEQTQLETALDLKIQKQSAMVDELIDSVRRKKEKPFVRKLNVELKKSSDLNTKDIQATYSLSPILSKD